MRRTIFWTSVTVAFLTVLLSHRLWLFLPYIDAPELVVPVVGGSIVGAVITLVAIVAAWFTRPISNAND
jgi:hypothetical protein